MRYNNIEMHVLVKGKAITEYPHMGQVFVEGRNGSDFEIEIRNNNSFSVEAVLAVDGLSVIDGKDAGERSSGYLIEANSSIRIPGWKLNDEQVAAFKFAGKGQSYAAQSTGSARNTGVIGVLAYAEKPRVQTYTGQTMLFGGVVPSVPWSGGYVGGSNSGDIVWCDSSDARGSLDYGSHDMTASYASSPAGSLNMVGAASVATGSLASASIMPKGMMATRGMAAAIAASEAPKVEQTLGTAFGRATEFKTETVDFERGDLHAMIVLYYDDASGLKKRGIDLSRRSRRKENEQPVAFPGMSTGCKPPQGWNG